MGVARAVKQEMSSIDQKNPLLNQNSLRPLHSFGSSHLSHPAVSTRVTVLVCTPRITLRAPEKKNLHPKNSLLKMRKKSVHQKVSTKSHGFHITFKSSFVWLSKRKASCKEAAASLKKPPDAYWELLNMWRPFKLSQHQARMYSWQHKSAETDCLKNMLI